MISKLPVLLFIRTEKAVLKERGDVIADELICIGSRSRRER